MATTKQRNTTNTLKNAINKYYLEKFFIHGRTSAIVPDKRWDNGLCEIVKVLRQIDKVLGDVEDYLILSVGSDITKSASLKILGEIRSLLCKGELEGKNIEEVYEIAEETSRLLKGIGRKSFILNLTASLNSSESIKILNNCGKKLSDMMLLWKKTKLRSEKMTAEVKVLIKKILNESSIEKIIKHLNKFVDKKYTENWDLFRDTDKQITVEIKNKNSFKENNSFIVKDSKPILEQLNKMWTFEEIKETGDDAKTKILEIFKSLKEMVEVDKKELRYSKKFQTLVKNIVCHLGGGKSEESDESVEISVIDEEYIENEKGLVDAAISASRALRDLLKEANESLVKMKEAQSKLEEKGKALKKSADAVNAKNPESVVPFMKVLETLNDAKNAYNDACDIFPADGNLEGFADKAETLVEEFCDTIQRVPTEARAKELTKDLFIITKIPKKKINKNGHKYELKRTPWLLNAIKNGEEAGKLYLAKIDNMDKFKELEKESLTKALTCLESLVDGSYNLMNGTADMGGSLEAAQKSLTTSAQKLDPIYGLKLLSESREDLSSDVRSYITAETNYNTLYAKNKMGSFLKRLEILEGVLSKINGINSEFNTGGKTVDELLEKVKELKGSFNEVSRAAKEAKKQALDKACDALELATQAANSANLNVSDSEISGKIKETKNKVDIDDTASVGDILRKVAEFVSQIDNVIYKEGKITPGVVDKAKAAAEKAKREADELKGNALKNIEECTENAKKILSSCYYNPITEADYFFDNYNYAFNARDMANANYENDNRYNDRIRAFDVYNQTRQYFEKFVHTRTDVKKFYYVELTKKYIESVKSHCKNIIEGKGFDKIKEDKFAKNLKEQAKAVMKSISQQEQKLRTANEVKDFEDILRQLKSEAEKVHGYEEIIKDVVETIKNKESADTALDEVNKFKTDALNKFEGGSILGGPPNYYDQHPKKCEDFNRTDRLFGTVMEKYEKANKMYDGIIETMRGQVDYNKFGRTCRDVSTNYRSVAEEFENLKRTFDRLANGWIIENEPKATVAKKAQAKAEEAQRAAEEAKRKAKKAEADLEEGSSKGYAEAEKKLEEKKETSNDLDLELRANKSLMWIRSVTDKFEEITKRYGEVEEEFKKLEKTFNELAATAEENKRYSEEMESFRNSMVKEREGAAETSSKPIDTAEEVSAEHSEENELEKSVPVEEREDTKAAQTTEETQPVPEVATDTEVTEEDEGAAEEAKRQAEEEARLKAEEEERLRAEEEARQKAEEEARQKQEVEAAKQEAEAAQKAAEEAKGKAEAAKGEVEEAGANLEGSSEEYVAAQGRFEEADRKLEDAQDVVDYNEAKEAFEEVAKTFKKLAAAAEEAKKKAEEEEAKRKAEEEARQKEEAEAAAKTAQEAAQEASERAKGVEDYIQDSEGYAAAEEQLKEANGRLKSAQDVEGYNEAKEAFREVEKEFKELEETFNKLAAAAEEAKRKAEEEEAKRQAEAKGEAEKAKSEAETTKWEANQALNAARNSFTEFENAQTESEISKYREIEDKETDGEKNLETAEQKYSDGKYADAVVSFKEANEIFKKVEEDSENFEQLCNKKNKSTELLNKAKEKAEEAQTAAKKAKELAESLNEEISLLASNYKSNDYEQKVSAANQALGKISSTDKPKTHAIAKMWSNYAKAAEQAARIKINGYCKLLAKKEYDKIKSEYTKAEKTYSAAKKNPTTEQMSAAEKAYIAVYKKFVNFSIEAAYTKAIFAYNETEALKKIFSTISDAVSNEYEKRRSQFGNNTFEFARNICINCMGEYRNVEQAKEKAITAYSAFKSSEAANIDSGDVESIVNICENAFNKADTLTTNIKTIVERDCLKALKEDAEQADSKMQASK